MTTADTERRRQRPRHPGRPVRHGCRQVDPGKVERDGLDVQPGPRLRRRVPRLPRLPVRRRTAASSPPTARARSSNRTASRPTPATSTSPSIGVAELAGSQTVTRTVTSVADKTVKWKVKVDAPAGYDVTVTPNQLTLHPGESATYEVTITNDGSGPIGEWRFGSLDVEGRRLRGPQPDRRQGVADRRPPVDQRHRHRRVDELRRAVRLHRPVHRRRRTASSPAPDDGDISQDPDQTYPRATTALVST